MENRSAARRLALRALHDLETRDTYIGISLHNLLKSSNLPAREKGFVTEVVYGVLRQRSLLDWYVRQATGREPAGLDPWTRNILRMGVYQCLFLKSVPCAVAVSESVDLAKAYGGLGRAALVNAILRRVVLHLGDIGFPDIEKEPVLHIAVSCSHPEWLVGRWVERFGVEETLRLTRANNLPPQTSLRVNLLKADREAVLKRLLEEGINAAPSQLLPEGIRLERGTSPVTDLEVYREGLITPQDEAAMLASYALAPTPGQFIIDVCGAPGGKSTHMAELMGDRGRIVSVDIHEGRLHELEKNVRRLGLTSIEPLRLDARKIGEHYPCQADGVLVDAPCSGTGVFRRRPDARWRRQPEDISSLRELQLEIISAASRCVKPGGILLYSTCSLEREENEDVVLGFLDEHPDFHLEMAYPFLPLGFRRSFPPPETLYIYLFPHIHGSDGFFIARLART